MHSILERLKFEQQKNEHIMNMHDKLESAFGKIENSIMLSKAERWKQELPWKKYAQQIALEVLEHLDKTGKTQKDFAVMMGVTPQMVNKWLSGKENFTLQTISKIEFVLGISLFQIPIAQQERTWVMKTLSSLQETYNRPHDSKDSFRTSNTKVVPLHSVYNDYLIAQ